jgi:hypothetical protein
MPRGRRFTSRHLSSQNKAIHVERNGVVPTRHKHHYGKKNPPFHNNGCDITGDVLDDRDAAADLGERRNRQNSWPDPLDDTHHLFKADQIY